MNSEATRLTFEWMSDGDLGYGLFSIDELERLMGSKTAWRTAKTWGEIRRAVPDEEFEEHLWSLELLYVDGGLRIPEELPGDNEEIQIVLPNQRVRPEQRLDTSGEDFFPTPLGIGDIPNEIGEQFGELIGGFTAGVWWGFPPSARSALEEALARHGFTFETFPQWEEVWG